MLRLNEDLEEKIGSRRTKTRVYSDQRYNSNNQENYQSVSPFMTTSTKKENMDPRLRTNSKMSEFINNMFLEKINYGNCTSSKSDFKKQDKRQIILRIVDDRVNRMF